MPSLDVHFFVSAVLLQKRTGGNLAEILDKLAYVIRERFKLRGRMGHDLAAPIPGAAALAAGPDWHAPAQRLRKAVLDFNAFAGSLQPHFAYGQLSNADFALAHVLHIANHQDEIGPG